MNSVRQATGDLSWSSYEFATVALLFQMKISA